jgi:hypothetical protein
VVQYRGTDPFHGDERHLLEGPDGLDRLENVPTHLLQPRLDHQRRETSAKGGVTPFPADDFDVQLQVTLVGRSTGCQ